jgi:hypothetical protein
MKQITFNGETHVVSRVRNNLVELVNAEGKLTRILPSELGQVDHIWRGVVPDAISFQQRPRSFLQTLRNRRDVDLSARVRQKREAKKKLEIGEKRQSKKSALDASLNAAMANLPPELALLMAGQLAGLKTKKPSKKKGTVNG